MSEYALTRQQSRELDRRAIEELGIPGLVLMENAGRGCVDALDRLGISGPIVILCGKGNNAGDGFVIARHLQLRAHECRVILLGAPTELRGDAAANYAILTKCNLPIVDLSSLANDALAGALDRHAAGAAWLIDALLGTGAVGEPRPPFDAVINWMNTHNPTTRVLAVDLPSGLDCDSGEPARLTTRADHTCTFAAMKTGFTNPAARPYLGVVHICDIGVPLSIPSPLA